MEHSLSMVTRLSEKAVQCLLLLNTDRSGYRLVLDDRFFFDEICEHIVQLNLFFFFFTEIVLPAPY